jgi:Icc-related predicted phosphoesterase
MIIDCISDLHGLYPTLEGGDLLIVAGDLTARDTEKQHAEFAYWLEKQKYRKKIVIAGNQDGLIQNVKKSYAEKMFPDATYLEDSGTEFDGLKIWGSPWSLWFPGINPKCISFICHEKKLADEYDKIPRDIDILITHTPAQGILDKTKDDRHVGSRALYCWLKYVGRPRLHVCGHIHEAYGQEKEFVSRHNDEMMLSVNCSIVNENYEHVNEPIRVIL